MPTSRISPKISDYCDWCFDLVSSRWTERFEQYEGIGIKRLIPMRRRRRLYFKSRTPMSVHITDIEN